MPLKYDRKRYMTFVLFCLNGASIPILQLQIILQFISLQINQIEYTHTALDKQSVHFLSKQR
jgi:hypothetical protein